jgi:phosphoribosylanthranilate isomerase
MIRIKVCGMREPGNIKEIAEAKPDYMGFIFYPGSKRYAGDHPETFRNIHADIKKTGVFVDEEEQKILEISSLAGLDAVQLHGAESPSYCKEIRSSGLTVIKTFQIGPDFRFEALKPYESSCDFFLFDTKSELRGGSGEKFNWELLSNYTVDKPFFLSGGIGIEDSKIIKSLKNHGLYAVDINSRFEISPGIKDTEKIKTFIKEIKEDSYGL